MPNDIHLKECIQKVTENGYSGTVVWGVVGTLGSYRDGNTSCCSTLRRTNPLIGTPRLVVLRVDKRHLPSEGVCREYINWLFNESPLSDCYESKSWDEVLDTGCGLVRCDVRANIMMIAIQAFRYIWEYKGIAESFLQLVKVGLDKDYAFVGAHLIARGKFVPFEGNNNHHIFDRGCTANVLKDFKSKSYANIEPVFSGVGTYKGVQHTWLYDIGASSCLYEQVSSKLDFKKKSVSTAFGDVGVNEASEDIYTKVKRAIETIIGED